MVATPTFPVPDSSLALHRLYRWEREAPEATVLTQPVRESGGQLKVLDYTWRQVIDEARRMAAYLQSLGLPRGAHIALLSKNCAHWLIADFAIWIGGYVSIPLYPTLSAAAVRQILEHSESRLLFVGKLDDWASVQSGVPADLPCVALPLAPADTRFAQWAAIVRHTAPLRGEPLRAGAELASVVYTSGTTGEPKGVMHTFANFAWATDAGLERIPLDRQTRLLSHLPLAHVAERAMIEHALLAKGFRVYFAESIDTFADDLRRARPTAFFTVPRLWVKFQQGVHARIPPRKLRVLLSLPILGSLVRRKIIEGLGLDRCAIALGGAAPMPLAVLQWYQLLGLSMAEGYGMTENCGVSHATQPGLPRPGTVGRPYAGVQCRTDPVSGEIQVLSGALTTGYYKDPDATREIFCADGWLRTGDQGEIDGEGNLRITGRLKDLFKTSKGKYVAPAPIEDVLQAHPAIEACCVMGAGLPQPLAVAVLSPQAASASLSDVERERTSHALDAHLRAVNQQLAPHEKLQCLVLVAKTAWTTDNGFVTPTLKVRRHQVEVAYGAKCVSWAAQQRSVVWA